ncbi:MAG: uvrD1 [Naasia sp.]|nr:uvrD1 [Naasia sp.]
MVIRGFTAASAGTGEVVLDPSQDAVLALPFGESAVVVGAPGSGKTTTLVELVADRVAGGTPAADLLVLSPTRTAATRLRDRIALRLPTPTGGPVARTAASVAFEIVRADSAARGDEQPRLLTGAEQDGILAALLDGHAEEGKGPGWPESLGADVRRLPAFRTELRELLGRSTELNLSPGALANLGRREGVPEWEAAARFADEYQRVLDSFRSHSYDSAELLAEATALVKSGAPVRVPRLVLIDDAQDLASGVAELVGAWVSRGAALVAFGDPDLASTGFRGGRSDLLARLGPVLGLPAIRSLQLSGSHRAEPALRAVTAAITRRIGTSGFGTHRLRTVDVPADGAEGAVLRIEAPGRPEEIARLAHRLRELHIHDGVPWHRMAVVVRSGRLVPGFARGLAAAEVPTRTSLASRPLREEWAARHLVDAVAVAVGELPADAPTLAGLLQGPLGGIDPVGLRRLRLALRQEELAGGGARSAEDLLVEAMEGPGRLITIDAAPARRAARLAESIAAARTAHEQGASIEELLWLVWERSGLARTWSEQAEGIGVLADEANRHLDSAVALFTAAQRFVERSPGQPARMFLSEVLGADLPEDTLAPRARHDSVLVCAPTALIGTEFDVVAVSGLQEGVWPNLRLRGTLLHPDRLRLSADGVPVADVDARRAVLDDELRMLALAVSRARRHLILTNVASVDEQPSSLLRLLPPDLPLDDATDTTPLTLRGMVGSLRRRLARDPASPAAAAIARLRDEDVPGADPDSWYGMLPPSTESPLVDLDDPDARVSVSPSRLGAIEKSPLGWFVDVMAAAPSGLSASIGTVLHAAMEKLSLDPDAELSPQAVMAAVDERWNEFSFESPWVEEYERRRTARLADGLADYLSGFRQGGHELLGAEAEFQFELGSALVRGTIDRLERTADGTVVVVDLKTGRRWPTKDELPGHAQLGLYQLAAAHGALEGIPDGAEPGGAKLLFVADGVAGRLYREATQDALTPEALEEFRARVRDAATTMAGTLFPGADGLEERDPYARYSYRIHLVPAVSA